MPSFEFKGPIEGYVVNHMAKNYWRVERSMSQLEVLQEAWLIFNKCSNHYADTVTEPQHFMALFKTAWERRFTTLTLIDTKHRHASINTDDGDAVDVETPGDLDNDGYLRVMISQAPREVSMVLSLFLNAPVELLDLAVAAWKDNGKRCAGGNAHVAKLLGMPADSKPLDAVEDYFKR